TEFVAWVDKQLAEYYKSGQTQKWYEQALADFGLDPQLAPPIMKEMLNERRRRFGLSVGLHAGRRQRPFVGARPLKHAQGYRCLARLRAGAGSHPRLAALVAPSRGVMAGGLRHRGLPHDATARPAVLVLLRPPDDR